MDFLMPNKKRKVTTDTQFLLDPQLDCGPPGKQYSWLTENGGQQYPIH